MTKTNLSLYVLALVVTAAIAWAYHTPIDVSIEARGIVRPEGEVVKVIAETGGRITRVDLWEGRKIRQGDTLIQLDTRELALKQGALESRIHSTETHIQKLRENLAEASEVETWTLKLDAHQQSTGRTVSELDLAQSRQRFTQTDRLFEAGLISRQSYEDARSSLDRAQAELTKWNPDTTDLKRAQSEARLHERQTEIDALHAELSGLYHQLEQSHLEAARLTILSPAEGTISAVSPLHGGEILTSGTAVATIIPDDHDLVIESWIPASEREWIKEGQAVTLETQSEIRNPQSAISPGIVLSISPDARVTESMAAYRVVVTQAEDRLPLRAGMTFRIHFITRQERLLSLLFHRLENAFTN